MKTVIAGLEKWGWEGKQGTPSPRLWRVNAARVDRNLKPVRDDESCVRDGETVEVKGVLDALKHIYGIYINNHFHPSP